DHKSKTYFGKRPRSNVQWRPSTLSLSPHRMRGEGGFSPVRGITWVTSAWWWCRVGPYGDSRRNRDLTRSDPLFRNLLDCRLIFNDFPIERRSGQNEGEIRPLSLRSGWCRRTQVVSRARPMAQAIGVKRTCQLTTR